MEKGFNKIVIVSLEDDFSRKIGKTLSENLDMMFCDAQDLMEYDLIDKDAIKKFCSEEYLLNAEKKVFQHISSFVNVVVSISFDALTHNFETLKDGSLIVFLKVPRNAIKEKINKIAYDNRSEELEKISTLTLKVKKLDCNFVCDKVIKAIGGIL